MLQTLLTGFVVSGGLIIAIGAQNAFVLKQGLLKQHVFWVCLTCFLCDFSLIGLGVLGLGGVMERYPTLQLSLAVFGAVFLTLYGIRAFISSYKGGQALSEDDRPAPHSLQKTLAFTLAITLLNPHVYLDTLVLIGISASPLTLEQKYLFLIGAWSASALWFFGLGYGARLLIPYFKKSITWRLLDAGIGLVMWGIAVGLFRYAYQLFGQL